MPTSDASTVNPPPGGSKRPPSVGVLTSIYHATREEELREAMESVLLQDRIPQEWVVVVDGPVHEGLQAVVAEYQSRCAESDPPITFTVVTLAANVGIGRARSGVLESMTSEFVAIQDADDISLPSRFTETVRFIENEHLDFAGCYLAEFRDHPSAVQRVRAYPSDPYELRRKLRLNNPIGHPSLVLRRKESVAVGGYRHLPGNEDYDLIARMVARGSRGASLPVPLVHFRAGPDMFRRRGGLELVRSEFELSRRLRSYGILGPVERLPILAARIAYRLAPGRAKRALYAIVVVRSPGG